MPTLAFDDTSDYSVTIEVTTADGVKSVTLDAEDADAEFRRLYRAHEKEGGDFDRDGYLAALTAWFADKGLAGAKWPTLCRARDAVQAHLRDCLGKGPAQPPSGPPG